MRRDSYLTLMTVSRLLIHLLTLYEALLLYGDNLRFPLTEIGV